MARQSFHGAARGLRSLYEQRASSLVVYRPAPIIRQHCGVALHNTAVHGAGIPAARGLGVGAKFSLALSIILAAAASVQLLSGLLARLEGRKAMAAEDVPLLACAAPLFGNVVHQLARSA